MARTPHDDFGGQGGSNAANGTENETVITLHGEGAGEGVIDLPGSGFVAEADILRDGQDLILQNPDGETIVIEGYFNADPAPVLMSSEGSALTPELVESFVQHAGPLQYAQAGGSMTDVSPVGVVQEVEGNATVTRTDGSTETIAIGTPIYQSDVIETDAEGAVNIEFSDESTFAVSNNARLAIDEYVFDPESESGTSNFSLLRGVFVFTSGLIGRDDPDDVEIDTPVGSIGIRGTTIAGHINPDGESQITIVEGAIVVSNGIEETTLAQQYETITLSGYNEAIQSGGTLDSGALQSDYGSLESVAPDFFSTLNDGANDGTQDTPATTDPAITETAPAQDTTPPAEEGAAADTTATDEAAATDGAVTDPTVEAPVDPALDATTGDPALDPAALTDPAMDPVLDPSANAGFEQGADYNNTSDPFADPAGTTNTTTDPGTTADSGAGGTTSTAPDPGATTDPGTTTETAPPPLLPLVLSFLGGKIDVTAAAPNIGDVVATIETTIDFPSVSFTVTGLIGFDFVQVSPTKIVIRYQGATLGNGPLSGVIVDAMLPDGRTVNDSFGIDGFTPPSLELTSFTGAVGDFDGDTVIDGFRIQGTSVGEHLGFSVASLGDKNADGLDDFLVTNNTGGGASVFTVTGTTLGGALGVSGSANPDARVSGIGDFNGDGVLDFIAGTGVDNTADIASAGVSSVGGAGDFGQSVAGIGDINGDGFSDVLIGAPTLLGTQGAAYVLFGSATPFSILDVSLLGTAPTDLGTTFGNTTPDGINEGFKILGGGTDFLGTNVGSAGDFNNDGFADFMVARPGNVVGSGVVDLYSGASPGAPLLSFTGISFDGTTKDIPLMNMGDLNGDGISDIGIAHTAGAGKIEVFFGGNTPNTTADFTIDGSTLGRTIDGGGAIGDFNGDGFDDAAIVLRDGSTVADIFVVFGDTGANLGAGLASIDLLDPSKVFHMTYETGTTGFFDFTISGIGDNNGDGFEDFVVGTPGDDAGGLNAGAATVVFGRDTDDRVVVDEGPGDVAFGSPGIIQAAGAGVSLIGSTGVDLLMDGGNSNVSMRGGAGNDVFALNTGNPGIIDGGSGFDEIAFSGAGQVLDFANVPNAGSEAISGIEEFNMSSDNQSVILGIDDIFRLLQESDNGQLKIVDSFAGGTSTFRIDDNTGFTGALSPVNMSVLGFTDQGTVINAGFQTWGFGATGAEYQLLIDQTITTQNIL